MSTVTRAFLRYLYRRKTLTALQFLGIALGVAATVGIVLSAEAALSSFIRAVGFLEGRATHTLERAAGPMDESILTRLMLDPAVDAFAPVLERSLQLAGGQTARLLGVDPFLDRALRPELAFAETGSGSGVGPAKGLDFLFQADAVLMESGLARRLKVQPGSRIDTAKGRMTVIGIFPHPTGEPLLIMDIAHVQALYGLDGRIDRVDLILNDPAGFTARWESGFRLQTALQRRQTLLRMLDSFRLNLEALSLLALFVGVFLIYNTAMFAVISRKKDAGILRSLGARRGEVTRAFLAEILILGAAAGAAGGGLGYILSRVLSGEIGGAVSGLYFFLRPAPAEWSAWVLVLGAGLGSAAGLLGSAGPLRELARIDPVQALNGRTADRDGRAGALRLAAAGLALIAAGVLLVILIPGRVYFGFAGALAILTGSSFMTGLGLVLLHRPIRGIARRLGGLPGKIASGNVRLNLGRTSVAVAAFMVALSMSIGMSTMIGSFRRSVGDWLERQLPGDLYISSLDEQDVPLALYEELRNLPGVAGVDPYRSTPLYYRDTTVYVSSVDAAVLQKFARFKFAAGGAENWDRVRDGEVLISESFARRFGVQAGDVITLNAARGPVGLRAAALFYDYTSEHGVVMMDRSLYLRLFEDPAITSAGVFIDPGNPLRAGIMAAAARRAMAYGLPVLTRDELHANALKVFDAAFAVTRSMRILAVIVAFFGIAGAILTLFIERRREFGVYRALGFSTGQVAGVTLMEGLVMGLMSCLMSLGVGTIMAALLIRVINLRSFHWTIFFHPSASPYLLAAATAAAASLGAAVIPIIRAVRTYPQMQIREE